MKIKVTKRTETVEEVDVEFPVYIGWEDSSDADGSSWETQIRVTKDGSLSITCRQGPASHQIEWEAAADAYPPERILGCNWPRNASTADKFHALAADFRKFVAGTPQ